MYLHQTARGTPSAICVALQFFERPRSFRAIAGTAFCAEHLAPCGISHLSMPGGQKKATWSGMCRLCFRRLNAVFCAKRGTRTKCLHSPGSWCTIDSHWSLMSQGAGAPHEVWRASAYESCTSWPLADWLAPSPLTGYARSFFLALG